MPILVHNVGMVQWYDVGQLAQTRVHAFLSTILGSMIDTRRLPTSKDPEDADVIDDHEKTETKFWFDYMADTGDGFAATYTMAHLLSADSVSGHCFDLRKLLQGRRRT